MTLSKSRLSQKNIDPTVIDLPSYESQYLYSFHQCPKCEKQSLVHIGNKLDCIWCDFSRDIPQKKKKKKTGGSEGGFWLLLIATIIIVLALR